MIAGDLERFLAVRRLEDRVARLAKRVADERPQPAIVLGEQHGFGSATAGRPAKREIRFGLIGRLAIFDPRQVHQERRALAGRGLDVNHASGLLNDSVDNRQAQTGATADFLRREERLEDAGGRLLIHAGSGIGDRQAYVVCRNRHVLDVVRRGADWRRWPGQSAAFRHPASHRAR